MGKSLRLMTLTSAIGFALIGAGMQNSMDAHAAGIDAAGSTTAQAASSEKYIITFTEEGLLNFGGNVAGLRATAPAKVGTRKLDTTSDAAHAYSDYLAQQRQSHQAAIEGVLGRGLAVTHSYSITLNGIAADLTAAEAAQIANLPGVKSVVAAGYEELVTYRGPKYIGADTIWNGTNTPDHVGTKGEGIVVGDLDGGINSDHPSFADDATCGFSATNHKLKAVDCSASSGGTCTGTNPEANPGYGHGVHTASTAAGNTIDNTANPPPSLPNGVTMSGVAPCATLYHYKVCQTNTCGGADILAGIQNAVADHVDVLNFSISGGTSPWADNDRDFLNAVNADVLVVAAAGNNSSTDPTVIGRVNHRGPWVLTVAAASQDQIIGPSLSVSGPGTPPAGTTQVPLNPGSTTPASSTPTYSGHPMKVYTTNIEGCTASGGVPSGTFTGAVAVLRRGNCNFSEKITNAKNAGADMVVIANNAVGPISMDTTGAPVVPAYSVSMASGDALIAFATAHTDAASDVAPIGIGATQGDVLADFSYRGPTPAPLADETKPDIAAPGVDIYAALDDQDGNYGFMSGTSMATPHTTGAGALMRAVHPDWTVTEVKSAMMMTATNADGRQEDGTTPWNIDDVGSGRVDLTKAALAGLTLDETYANFLAANPSGGSINIKALNIPALRNLTCTPNCTWTRTFKNQLSTSATWQVGSSTGGNFVISASPSNFTIAPGATQAVTFTATANGALTAIKFGEVTLHEAAGQSPDLHLSVALKGEGEPPVEDDTIFKDGFDGDGSPATCTPTQLFQDPSLEQEDTFWTNEDSLFGTSFCDATCDTTGTIVAHTGDIFAWLGGAPDAGTATLAQAVVIPAGQDRWLNFWMIDQLDTVSTLELTIDGTQVTTFPAGAISQTYATKSFQIPAQYVDGQSHDISLNYARAADGPNPSGAMIDDVTLDCSAAPARPTAPSDPVIASLRRHIH